MLPSPPTGMRAVRIDYPKGNATDMNRDTLWVQLADYGWRAVPQVIFTAEPSALRAPDAPRRGGHLAVG